MERKIYVYRYDTTKKKLLRCTAIYDLGEVKETLKGSYVVIRELPSKKRISKIPLERIDSFSRNINECLYLSKMNDAKALKHFEGKYEQKCKALEKELGLYQEHYNLFKSNKIQLLELER